MSLPAKNRPDDLNKIEDVHEPTKKARWTNRVAVFALLTIALSLGIFFYWSFATDQPLVVKNSPFPTRSVPPTPEKSDVLVLDIDYCKNTSAQGIVRASYVTETREIFMPEVVEQYTPGCRHEDIPVLIPDGLASGEYHLHFQVRYNLNPLKRDVIVEFQSQKFIITNDRVEIEE